MLRELDDIIQNEHKEKTNPTRLKGKKIFISGRHQKNFFFMHRDNKITIKSRESIRLNINSLGCHLQDYYEKADIVVHLYPYKSTKATRWAIEKGIPIVKDREFSELLSKESRIQYGG